MLQWQAHDHTELRSTEILDFIQIKVIESYNAPQRISAPRVSSCSLGTIRFVLRDRRFRQSIGIPLGAQHYRRSLADGSCLHLVIDGNRATIHRDRWDPHGDVVSLGRHCVYETPIGALAIVLGTSVLLRLALRAGRFP